MKGMKDRWGAMYSTLKSASKQKLRDNVSRFEKEKEIYQPNTSKTETTDRSGK